MHTLRTLFCALPLALHAPTLTVTASHASWSTTGIHQQDTTPWQRHADLTRARQVSDSFVVVVRDRPIGWQRLEWARDGAMWLMSDEVALSGIRQRSTVRFSASLTELSLRQDGTFDTTAMHIALDRVGGRMRGTARTPSGGPTPQSIDVQATDAMVDDNALTVMLPLVRWREGLTFTLPVLSSGTGSVERYTATVVERRSSTVPAGTFDVWHVEIAGGRYVLEADVTTAPPYRVVQFGPRGAAMRAQLVR